MTKAGRYLLTGVASAVVESALVEKVQSVSANDNNSNIAHNDFFLFSTCFIEPQNKSGMIIK